MAKQIQSFTVEIKQQGVETSGFVRYSINDSVATDLSKYGEFTQVITGTDTINALLVAVETEIKSRESIS